MTGLEPAATAGLADDASHILLVDDDRRIRTLMTRYLMQRGYRVTTAADCAEARACLRSISFDLIVLDVMMPGENGFEFTASFREESQVPILLLTARADSNDRVRGLEAGADDYLTKPFVLDVLLAKIRAVARRAATDSTRSGARESRRDGQFATESP